MYEDDVRPEDKVYIKKLFRVRQTVASMVRQRGYIDPGNVLQENDTFDEFSLKYRQNSSLLQNLLFFKSNDNATKLVVLFESENHKALTDQRVNDIMQRIHQQQINNVIIIVNGDPNQPNVVEKKARGKIDEINSMITYSCQLFNMDDIVFDITKHELVPQHIPINDEDKKALLVRYRLTESQLPRILLSDPVSKFLGLKQGDVVKIVRKSETAGIYVTYRIAI